MEAPQGAFELNLKLTDQAGKVAAELSSAMQPQVQKVTDITKSVDALVLRYQGDFQGQAFAAKIILTPDGADKAKVVFDVQDGMFQMNGTGARKK